MKLPLAVIACVLALAVCWLAVGSARTEVVEAPRARAQAAPAQDSATLVAPAEPFDAFDLGADMAVTPTPDGGRQLLNSPSTAAKRENPVVATITGRFVDEHGLPLQDVRYWMDLRSEDGESEVASVEVRGRDPNAAHVWFDWEPRRANGFGITDETGEFRVEFSKAPADPVRVRLMAAHHCSAAFARGVDLSIARDVDLGTCVVSEQPLEVFGVVIDASGAPIAGALVQPNGVPRADDRDVFRTDSRGRFSLPCVAASTVDSLFVAVDGLPPTSLARDSVASWADVTIRVFRGTRVSGEVLDDRGRALEGVRIQPGDSSAWAETAVSGPDGKYALTLVRANRVLLVAWRESESGEWRRLAAVSLILAEATERRVDFRLSDEPSETRVLDAGR